MHPEKAKRLRELAHIFLMDVEIDISGGRRLIGIASYLKSEPSERLGEFLLAAFPQYLTWPNASFHPIRILDRYIQALPVESGAKAGRGVLVEKEVTQILDGFMNWWSGVPHQHEYLFPLPKVIPQLLPVTFGSGIDLRVAPWQQNDYTTEVTRPFASLNALSGANPGEIPTLFVKTHGVHLVDDPLESAPRNGLHLAKVVLQMCVASGLLKKGYGPDGLCKFAYVSSPAEFTLEKRMSLPIGFSRTLRGLSVPYSPNQKVPGLFGQFSDEKAKARVRATAEVISRVMALVDVDAPPRSKRTDSEKEQAAKVATAAAWAFDAQADDFTAERVVRIAIAFETLLGGAKGDPVVETIKTRLEYLLGNSIQERSEISENFEAFYDVRSNVVHRGLTRLSRKEVGHLVWAEGLLNRALLAEASILPEKTAPPTGP